MAGTSAGAAQGRGAPPTPPTPEALALATLEWPAVCSLVGRFCATSAGRTRCEAPGGLPLAATLRGARLELARTASAQALGDRHGARLDFGGVDTVLAARAVDLASSGDAMALDDGALVALVALIDAAERLQRGVLSAGPGGEEDDGLAALRALVDAYEVPTACRKGLVPALDLDGGRLKDSASPELKKARGKAAKLAQKLRSMLGGVGARGAEVVQLSGGRLALKLPADDVTAELEKGSLLVGVEGGMATLEPRAAAALNAKLSEANAEAEAAARRAREQLAIAHVLPAAPELRRCLDLVATLDVVCARAAYASASGAMRPELVDLLAPPDPDGDDSSDADAPVPLAVSVRNAIHPLLREAHSQALAKHKEKSAGEAGEPAPAPAPEPPVPLDFEIADGVVVVTITGPNAGGKTAALKTLGLMAAMVRAGLFVPGTGEGVFGADYDGPCVPFFAAILADVGDSQSIVESLSTFTARMTRTAAAMKAAVETPPALVLLDEVGAGTDPLEGAALGAALMRGLAARLAGGGGLAVATTHHGELTALKYDLGVEAAQNASMEWDEAGEAPTYRVQWGVPGRSRGLSVARRLGVDSMAVDEAEEMIGGGRARADGLVEDMEAQRLRVAKAERRLRSCTDAMRAAEQRGAKAREEMLAREAVYWREGRSELDAAALRTKIRLRTMGEVRRAEAVEAGDESALAGLSKAKQRKLRRKIKAATAEDENESPQRGIVAELMEKQREQRVQEDLNLSELQMRRLRRQQQGRDDEAAAAASRPTDRYSKLLDEFGGATHKRNRGAKGREKQQPAAGDAAGDTAGGGANRKKAAKKGPGRPAVSETNQKLLKKAGRGNSLWGNI